MSFLTVNNLHKSFGKTIVLNGISFDLQAKEKLALVGKSGSGKTTLLRIIAGLETPDIGLIVLDDKIVNSDTIYTKPEKRNLGYVFQNHSLFPHLNVYKNIVFGIDKQPKSIKKQIALDYLNILGLGRKLYSYPHELSGGEKQRISIIRTLAYKPKLLLLDEPFSNLDRDTKDKLKIDLKKILDHENIPTILITHDAVDSFDLADRVILLEEGKIVAQGEPEILFNNPSNLNSAKYFSETNIVIRNDSNSAFFEKFNLKDDSISILPKSIKISENGIPAIVESQRFLGEGNYVYIDCLGVKLKLFSVEKVKEASIFIQIDSSQVNNFSE